MVTLLFCRGSSKFVIEAKETEEDGGRTGGFLFMLTVPNGVGGEMRPGKVAAMKVTYRRKAGT